jgi:hypothetical protein
VGLGSSIQSVVLRLDLYSDGGVSNINNQAGALLDGEAHIFAADDSAEGAVLLMGLHGGAWVE